MNIIRKNFLYLSLMLVIPILNICYFLLNNFHIQDVNTLVTSLDRQIPFLKFFVIPYLFWYPFMFVTLSFLCFKDKNAYIKTLVSVVIGLLICYIIYYFYQTTVPRPQLVGNDLLTSLVSLVYWHDQPYNCFPSIHCLTSFLMIKGLCSSTIKNKTNFLVIGFFAIFIIISTIFIKQHVLLDVLAAILLADLIFRIVSNYRICTSGMRKQRSFLITKKKLTYNK